MNDVMIIDYGLCNLRSISNAFKYLNITSKVVTNPDDLKESEHIILPGVGAFKEGMTGLDKAGFIKPLKEAVEQNKMILGICLGMQMLLSESYEFEKHVGLGFIDGTVKPLKSVKKQEEYIIKVPHIGWNSFQKFNELENTPFSNIKTTTQMYFVHSYYCDVNQSDNILTKTMYGNVDFHSIIAKNNIYGCQFHPERSGQEGLLILKNFASMTTKKNRRINNVSANQR